MVDLVTGASGFVGKALVQAMLKEGRKVRILARKTSKLEGLESLNLDIVYGDLRNKASLVKATKGVDNVIHLAFSRRASSLAEMNKTNATGTRNLLQACEKNKVKHVLFFSSVTVYGEALDVHENSPFKPYDDYGKSKAETEKVVAEFRKTSKIPITTLRPTYIYGQGDPFSIAQIIKAIKKGRFFVIGSGENLMNLIYIDDVVGLAQKVLKDRTVQNRDYIVSGPKPCTLSELSSTISNVLNVREPQRIPYAVGYGLGMGLDIVSKVVGKRMPLSRQRVKNMTRSRSYRTDRARKELGFTHPTSLEEGLKKTA